MQTEDLSKKSYWDDRFVTEEAFEWFGECSRLYPVFDVIFGSSPSVEVLLHLGCGSSSLAEEMFSRSYCQSIVNVDYSFAILDKRRRKKTDRSLVDWLTLDIRALPLREDFFDCIVEKGTLDVFFVGHEHQLWNPSEELKERIDGILTEISRCLRNEAGRFISISFQQPHFRRRFLAKKKYRWSIDVHSVSDRHESVEYFVYVMTRGQSMSEEDQLLEQGISKRWSWINHKQSIDTTHLQEDTEDFLSLIDL